MRKMLLIMLGISYCSLLMAENAFEGFIDENPTLQNKIKNNIPNKEQSQINKQEQRNIVEDIYSLKVCDQEYCDCSNRSCAEGMTCKEKHALNGTLYLCIKDVKKDQKKDQKKS